MKTAEFSLSGVQDLAHIGSILVHLHDEFVHAGEGTCPRIRETNSRVMCLIVDVEFTELLVESNTSLARYFVQLRIAIAVTFANVALGAINLLPTFRSTEGGLCRL